MASAARFANRNRGVLSTIDARFPGIRMPPTMRATRSAARLRSTLHSASRSRLRCFVPRRCPHSPRPIGATTRVARGRRVVHYFRGTHTPTRRNGPSIRSGVWRSRLPLVVGPRTVVRSPSLSFECRVSSQHHSWRHPVSCRGPACPSDLSLLRWLHCTRTNRTRTRWRRSTRRAAYGPGR